MFKKCAKGAPYDYLFLPLLAKIRFCDTIIGMVEVVESRPRVSVVIPVYCHTDDHEEFLREALESVASQTFRDFEVVIVDDVSPRGGLIAFLDHDDLWMPDKLARQVEVIDANPDAAMVFCDMITLGAHANRLRINQEIIPKRPGFYWFASHWQHALSASSVLVKRQAMLDIGLFDDRYSTCDDLDAWLKMLMNAPVVHLPEKLAKYRLHSLNVNYTVDRLNDNRLLTALIWRYWCTAPIIDKIRLLPRLGRKYVGRAYFTVRRFRKFKG